VTPFRIAVIADAHLHDVTADYGHGSGLALRPASDVVKAVRVANESAAALRHALRDIAARGIGHVVLLGDMTDDGQVGAVAALAQMLEEARGWGLHFWAVPGNHDVFADGGRHRSRRIARADGGHDLLTSDPDRTDPTAARVVVSPRMQCLGVPEGLPAGVGFFHAPQEMHWETPFGADDAPAARRYAVRSDDGTVERWLMDASYLVEPQPGVWLMMIDANVWVPQGTQGTWDGSYVDSSGAGWTAMLRHKPFVLRWMADVAARAAASGKRLLTFSHYPVLDPLQGSRASEQVLLGLTPLARRMPGPEVAQAVAATGIGVHFGGHLHLNATTCATTGRPLVDVAVPSLVAFPAAYKIVTVGPVLHVETVAVDMPMPSLMPYPGRLGGHGRYGAFLAAHAGHLVARRHLRREWPPSLAALVPGLTLAGMTGGPQGAEVSALSVIEDFYRVRMGGSFGAALIPPARRDLYRAAAQGTGRWAPLFAMLCSDMDRPPARDFTIDPATGAVTAA